MKVYFGVLLLVLGCSSEDYNLTDDYSDHTDSVEDSGVSGEVYNVTLAHKPERIVKLITENELSSAEDLTEKSSKPTVQLQEFTSKIKVKKAAPEKKPAPKTIKYSNLTNSEMSEEEPPPKNKSAVHKSYPYVVSLQKKGSHYATGALVSESWVLTSAGEFYNVRESIKLFRARMGSVDCKKFGKLVPLRRIEIHPSYILRKANYDIALINLAHPVPLSDSIKPIAFSKVVRHLPSGKFTSTYWPRILVKGQVLPSSAKERVKFNSLRVSTQHLIPWNKCYDAVNEQNEVLSASSMCLQPVLAHHSICSPDVGAPVVSDDGLWGVTSGWIGMLCPKYPSPTVVTRISATNIQSWLNMTIQS